MPKSKRSRIRPCGGTACQPHPYCLVAVQHTAINRVLTPLAEKKRRRFVGLLAIQWGQRCITALTRITGLSGNTLRRGKHASAHPTSKRTDRIRQPDAGRPPLEKTNPTF